ncbi:MAG: dihydroorotate dehydrogenase-like protein [Bacteroidales bacterium]|nr:dihydroorotate dehydrogenase-like protein [Bacteroidales bacterium]
MSNLKTEYMGIPLKNPVIVSSSGLTDSAEKIRKLEELGAGAVVMKSLFEEQISYEAGTLYENGIYPEAGDYIVRYSRDNSVEEYLRTIEDAKKQTEIPVIASINCISSSEWISFAKDIEKAGADALELNIFYIAQEKDKHASEYEKLYADILTKVKNIIKIPIAVKIGYYFTNLIAVVNNLYMRGVNGVVLFNRFFEPDIDIEKMKITSASVFSNPSDLRQSLRWVGIISDRVRDIDIAASTGIHDGKAIIKQMLAGAKVVQICSVLYQKGIQELPVLIRELEEWMKRKQFKSVDAFRGMLNYGRIPDPAVYERSQFMKYFSGYH